ncbi:MAG: elongation factor P [Candidatus Kapabacteria bacterium]|nr:elongation factor P [Ignavibacteriota bacterium]MCW5885247.1 elongation factor P [Candidatus Kapabacteria bacterium]
MATTSDFKANAMLKYNNEIFSIVEFQHVQTGRGGAYYQTKMRNVKTGKIIENRFRSGETVDMVSVSRRNYQYLYKDGENLVFMNLDDYEQIYVPAHTIGDEIRFLKDNENVIIAFDNETVLSVDVPQHVNLRVIATEPGLKGDTATNVLKPATLETGAIINVPLFVNEGDLIRLDTKSETYIERVKE